MSTFVSTNPANFADVVAEVPAASVSDIVEALPIRGNRIFRVDAMAESATSARKSAGRSTCARNAAQAASERPSAMVPPR